jgi:hypothetical protein
MRKFFIRREKLSIFVLSAMSQGMKIFKADNTCQKENIDDTHQQRIIFQKKYNN